MLVLEVERARDAAMTLAQQRAYREFPQSWMISALARYGLTVFKSKTEDIWLGKTFPTSQLGWALGEAAKIRSKPLRAAMVAHINVRILSLFFFFFSFLFFSLLFFAPVVILQIDLLCVCLLVQYTSARPRNSYVLTVFSNWSVKEQQQALCHLAYVRARRHADDIIFIS